jgi:hypothetical protein
MNRPVVIKVISTDASFVARLHSSKIASPSDSGALTGELQLEKGAALHVPGAMHGWWEIAVAIGVAAAPVTVLTSVLATWISENLVGTKPHGETKIVLRSSDGRVSEVAVSSADPAIILVALQAALQNVDRAD